MGDDEEPASFFLLFVDGFRDDIDRIDIETRVDFIEHREFRIQEFHLEDLVPLLLAPAEPFVQIAVAHLERDAHIRISVFEAAIELEETHRLFPAGVHRRLEEVRAVDSRDLGGILHGKEKAGLGPFVDAHREKIPAIEIGFAFGDRVVGISHQSTEQRAFAVAVRP